MTKQEWDQMEDELEPIIKQVRKICKEHDLSQLDIAAFPNADDLCWATGFTGHEGNSGDFYTLNVYNDNRTTHELNGEIYYTKS